LDGPCPEAKTTIKHNIGTHDYKVLEIPHGGACAARNAGFAEAKGDLLCFFDCDCIIEPGASAMWVEQFDKHPEIGFIYSGYKFIGDKFAIESEPWNPYTLKIRNYISACFPVRRSLYPGWDTSLESLQDWDFWLGVLGKSHELDFAPDKVGRFVPGFAFATAFPDQDSISGRGCGVDVWLSRLDAVKRKHHLTDRDICVSSLEYRADALGLAKLINADFLTVANDKPHRYKTIIQVGFSLGKNVEKHAAMFEEKNVKKVLFWTGDNISEIYHGVSFKQIDAISTLINGMVLQFCEDVEAKKLLTRAGFKAEVLPLPMGSANPLPLPEEKKWAWDISGVYSPMLSAIEQSLPDIPLEQVGPATDLSNYVGLLHFFQDKTVSSTIRRAHMTGRHVVSNVQQPFCGFVDDKWEMEKFITEAVSRVRSLSHYPVSPEAAEYYSPGISKLMGVLR
jgi:glycosyltransferase involved in cell wall biosynthesis